MSWAMLEKMLAEVATHSTLVGKYWFSFLFLFRVIVVLSIGDKVYGDEQAKFVCNTLQPGCDNVCFNRFSPISHIRFWAMQILMVSLPSIVFIVWAMHALNKVKILREKAEKEAEKMEVATDPMVKDPTNKQAVRQRYSDLPPKYNGSEKKMPNGKRGKPQSYTMVPMAEVIPVKTVMPKAPVKKIKDPPVLVAYVFQVIFRSIIECGFIIMQYLLFHTSVPEMYRCERYPCPQVVECFISRPMEKTIFMIFMYAIAGLCLFLDIVELKYLGYRKIKHCLSGNKDSAYLDDFEDRWHNDPYLAGRFNMTRGGGLRRHRDMSITDPDNDDDDIQYNSVETSDDGSGFE